MRIHMIPSEKASLEEFVGTVRGELLKQIGDSFPLSEKSEKRMQRALKNSIIQ